jgi:hypothetical protein
MASTYIYRDLGTPTNAYKGTVSHWIKKGVVGVSEGSYGTFSAWDNGGTATNRGHLNIYNDTIYFYDQPTSTILQTNRVLRDVSAWYHIVIAWDTTQVTASDRIKIYVNGTQETSFSTANYPSQNATLQFNTSGRRFGVGCFGTGGNAGYFWDGSISHFHFVDGSQLAPTVFGSTDSTTGEWKINTSPSYTVGNNGFFWLKDSIATTDHSSNSNTFTVGGGTLTKTEDNPSNVFATLNGLNANNQPTLTNGNNTLSVGSNTWKISPSTLAVSSGKWYVEHKITVNNGFVGIGIIDTDDYANDTSINYSGENANSVMVYSSTGQKWINNTNSSYGDSYTTNDIIGIAMDLDNNKIYFSKNGTFMNSGDPTSGATGTGAIDIPTGGSGEFFILPSIYNATVQCNFGNGYFGTTAVSSAGTNASGIGIFEYDVPTGYTALSTKGLNL